MSFGYIPDYKNKSFLKDLYMKVIGYPYPPRRNEVALIFALLNPQMGEKILDIGCGDGVWYNELRKRGIDVTGIDLSAYDLGKLKERAESMFVVPKVLEADAQKMPFESETFDKAYSICTFEHIRNDQAAFRETARILRPGGCFVVSLPMKDTPLLTKIAVRMPLQIKRLLYTDLVIEAQNSEQYLENFNKRHAHYRNYTLTCIRERIKDSGFELTDQTYNCRFFGSAIWSLYHTLKIFERKKSPTTEYQFKNQLAFALAAPAFYALVLIDRLLFWTRGRIIILRLRKR